MPTFDKFKETVAQYLASSEPHANSAMEVLAASDAAIEQLGRAAHDVNSGFSADGSALAAAAAQISSDPQAMASLMEAAQYAAHETWGSLRQTPDSELANAGIGAPELVASAAELAGELREVASLEGMEVTELPTPEDVRAFVEANPDVMGQLKDMLADKIEHQQNGQPLEGFGLSADSPQFSMGDLFIAAAADQVHSATELVYAEGGSPKSIGMDAYGQQVLQEALTSVSHGEISVEALVALQEVSPSQLGEITDALTQSLTEAARQGQVLDFRQTVEAVVDSFPADSMIRESPAAAAEAASCFLECATRQALASGELTAEQANFLRETQREALEQFDQQFDRGTYFAEQPATQAEIEALSEQSASYAAQETAMEESQREAVAEREMAMD